MATWKSTAEERAQAAQLVLRKVDDGVPLADSVRHFANVLEVSEDTLRRWVRQEKANPSAAAAEPEPVAATAAAPEPVAVPTATAVLDRPETVDPIDALFQRPQSVEASFPPPRRPNTLRRLAMVAVAIVAALVAAGLVGSLQDSPREKAEARINDYVAGKGTHEFVATDSNFRASFPFGAPRRETQTRQIGGLTVEFITYGTESDSGAFSVGSLAVPSGVPYDLNAGVNGAAVAMDGHIDSATPITFQNFPAMEFVFSGSLSGHKYIDKGLIVNAGGRVYILQAIWEAGPAPGYDAFKASFHIG
jgi:transposase-like protein